MEHNVVRLPLTGLAGGIYQGCIVAIKRGCLTVEIGFVLMGIEHLDLVASLKVDAAVAPSLSFTLHYSG